MLMLIVSTKFLFFLGLYWISKVGVTLGQSRECTRGYPSWRCNSGQCLWKGRVCDGYSHCTDGSDESPAICCASTCPSDPDICIPAGQEVIPGKDCRDCNHNYGGPGWRCNSGQCIKKSHVCDGGQPDCPDGSDEFPKTCCPSTCPSDPDICVRSGQEILPGKDCRDCTTVNGDPGWRCNSGQCLEKWKVCDGGSPECFDGSDESPATCCASTCPSDPDICIPAGVEILPGQDCRDCNPLQAHLYRRTNSGICSNKFRPEIPENYGNNGRK